MHRGAPRRMKIGLFSREDIEMQRVRLLNSVWIRAGTLIFIFLAVAILISLGMAKLVPYIEGLEKYGYFGIFLISFVAASPVIPPAPLMAIAVVIATAAVATWANPILVVIIFAFGNALGEGVGYGVSRFGVKITHISIPLVQKTEDWIKRYGGWVIAFLACFPVIIFFDIVGIVAGTLRYPFPSFLFFCFLGGLIRFSLLILLGAEIVKRFLPFV
ncbi:YqaA family protein [Candidatus Hakubella thermalkaliphila]|uniref:VTT domain-containing protein n=2 Tax=Candidatus Hakubella thermalkaliphila TaxID=2754717 RepID=A0A6V8P6I1_9ACTN|nr:VTT domain-containing protein [Candidatus Hakubella thermalkaliphila]GFP24737.1 hypothetical protein HKBW3S25_00174 [Candidatus Hakubella thermalkaliphila]GFP27947.1 hypothetical protein HKBW3S33_01358 [Candidatus Hakubella thermalkaliphila]